MRLICESLRYVILLLEKGITLTRSDSCDSFAKKKTYFVGHLEVYHVFPAKLVSFPVWPGYWHDFGARQNLPSECLCLGQMVMRVIWVADIARIPALAMISSASVTSPHFDR